MSPPPPPTPAYPIALYRWRGRDPQGRPTYGEMRASGTAQVQQALRAQGIYITHLRAHTARSVRHIPPATLSVITRQIASMLQAGVSLLQCLEIVARSHHQPRVVQRLTALRQDIETGQALSVALRQYPRDFNDLYCHLIEAGEASGMLDAMMERIATHMEKAQAIQSKIRAALTYPAAVVAVATLVVATIMVYVVPAFQGVFASFGAELPLLTRMVMGSSDALRQQGVWLLIGTCLGALVLRYVWKSRPHIRYRLQTLALQIPWLGPLWRKACLARWSRTLATLFGAGVPLMEALDGVAGAAGHALYQNATQRIRLDVATGIPLSQAMQRTAVFPPMLLQMSAIGEASGALESMLAKAADFYEQDVDETVAQLSSLIEPLLIVSLGAIIGTIVVAMYLPIFSLGHIV